jgi:sulfur carrier protein
LQILVNGEPLTTDASTLAAQAKVATAVNGSFVASAKRECTQLSPKDEIEIVAPRQGG